MTLDFSGPGLWYATRAAGLVALLLLTASVLLGVLTAGAVALATAGRVPHRGPARHVAARPGVPGPAHRDHGARRITSIQLSATFIRSPPVTVWLGLDAVGAGPAHRRAGHQPGLRIRLGHWGLAAGATAGTQAGARGRARRGRRHRTPARNRGGRDDRRRRGRGGRGARRLAQRGRNAGAPRLSLMAAAAVGRAGAVAERNTTVRARPHLLPARAGRRPSPYAGPPQQRPPRLLAGTSATTSRSARADPQLRPGPAARARRNGPGNGPIEADRAVGAHRPGRGRFPDRPEDALGGRRAGPAVVLANGAEGEPRSGKTRPPLTACRRAHGWDNPRLGPGGHPLRAQETGLLASLRRAAASGTAPEPIRCRSR